MQCPVCEDQQLSISSREGVEIDYCPQCRGVWLDRGELDKVIDRALGSGLGGPAPPQAPAQAPPPPYQGARVDDRHGNDYGRGDPRYDKRRKRRSFLEEIFDFD